MRDKDSARRRSEGCGQVLRSKVPVLGININKDGPRPHSVNTQKVAAVIVSRHDDLVTRPDLQRPQGQLDCERTAATGKNMFNLVQHGQALLQPGDVAAMITAPRTVAVR